MAVEDVEAIKNNKKLQSLARKQRLAFEHGEKMKSLFEYYASTDIPVERVADHMGLSVDEARIGLRRFGRAA